MSGPVVSVIVPAYNEERHVSRCLRSLLAQTMPRDRFEIVLVNDGSSDRTAQVLEAFRDEIVLVEHDANRGLPASVNAAIRRARAPYVVRVDADDFVNARFLEMLHDFLRENRYMDAIACDYLLVDDQEEVLARKDCLAEPIACGIMFRIEHLIDIGLYDESFLLHEETELRVRFERKYRIHRLELPLYRYRRHAGNSSNDVAAMEHHRRRLVEKHGPDSGPGASR